MAKDNGHNSIPSLEIGQVWSYCCDNLRGTTPLAQEQIECLQRDFLPPSKSHIKRLKKHRPFVIKPRPPIPQNTAGRKSYGDAYRIGKEVKRMALRAAYERDLLPPTRQAEPVKYDFTRIATVPKRDDIASHDDYAEQAARLQRDFEAERARVNKVMGRE